MMENIIDEMCEDFGWTREESKNFLRSLRSTTPEQLQDDITRYMKWASKVEQEYALIDIIKRGLVKTEYRDGELFASLYASDEDIQNEEDVR